MPLPKLVIASTQAAAAPGTVTAWPCCWGKGFDSLKPSSFALCKVRALGDRPLAKQNARIARTLQVSAESNWNVNHWLDIFYKTRPRPTFNHLKIRNCFVYHINLFVDRSKVGAYTICLRIIRHISTTVVNDYARTSTTWHVIVSPQPFGNYTSVPFGPA